MTVLYELKKIVGKFQLAVIRKEIMEVVVVISVIFRQKISLVKKHKVQIIRRKSSRKKKLATRFHYIFKTSFFFKATCKRAAKYCKKCPDRELLKNFFVICSH